MGIHGSLLRGQMAPEFLSQGFSEILHSLLFWIFLIFSFFSGNAGWDPWNLNQDSGVNTKNFLIWDRFYHLTRFVPYLSILILFVSRFWRNLSHHQLGTKNVPEIRLKFRISWQQFSSIHNLTSLRFSFNPVMFKFGIFPFNFELSSWALSFQDHTLWFYVWHVVRMREIQSDTEKSLFI